MSASMTIASCVSAPPSPPRLRRGKLRRFMMAPAAVGRKRAAKALGDDVRCASRSTAFPPTSQVAKLSDSRASIRTLRNSSCCAIRRACDETGIIHDRDRAST